MWDMPPPYKARSESLILMVLRILNKRMKLTEDEQRYYQNQEKGFQGEVQFDILTEKLKRSSYILNDLQLESNKSSFQLDSSLIFQDTYSLFDVKNFEGEYVYGDEYFKTISGRDFQNPLDQLKRSKLLLSQLLQTLGSKLTVEAYVIFINPQFTLYQTPPDLPFILPTKLDSFMKKLDQGPSRLNDSHKTLADKLISLHQTVPPYTHLPSYEYDQLRKGITCKKCLSFSVSVQGKRVICHSCGFEEMVTSAVLRMVGEFSLLFPDRKITTNIIHEWCRVGISKKTISRTLGKYLMVKGVHQWTYYEWKVDK
ncbi:nuclease-related domain-containing protein [Neobacillus sp. DY30]|uniref:nuclease-related domain-containing protein n=1 Tax=Neobacillus sp. DY30 TaxID=3047871 RepID=UPI0024BF84AF|nr:nuclease-related domain-containing protein [Neobacillus sp. DY30]WHY00109.1 nuclease-related domain-containing protein [Neobacillus sp. DY30]